MKGYKHLTYSDRIKIEALYKAGFTRREIAVELGYSRSTIYREIERGLYPHTVDYRDIVLYSAYKSQKIHDYNASAKGVPLKIGNNYNLVNYIEHMILNEKYSPDAVVSYIKNNNLGFENMVSTRTIYNYINSGNIFQRITRESLWMKGQRKRKYDKVKHVRHNKPLLHSIEDRPKNILNCDVCGHWEMDTVVGKRDGGGDVLLVLTERKTRYEIIRKIPSKTQKAVIKALDSIEREVGCLFPKMFKTITIDNGGEFLDDIGIELSITGGKRTTVYYCHPYSSFERGSNENINKMVRRFIPKGADIRKYSHQYIKSKQTWINNYPRRILGGKSASDVFLAEMGMVI